ncbi:CoA transferase [Chelatococcus reniformis]|uniref:CoA transferase n=1 Tax=Chelatococcus reniformis TaxID=1494448 RepID=A0A916U504_9HYPH|nr:CoA transferase [Chelatococcus reniformis]
MPAHQPRPAEAQTPLADVTIVDFTHFIAGPFATLILADLGARVIKIENADEGDGFRSYPPHIGSEGVPYLWANRNKESVGLDLKSPAGREVALDLIERADVVVENFATGAMERLGLGYELLASRKPDLIFCSVSAYGRSGPSAGRVGFDPIVQAESGFISMNGFPEQEGVRAGPSIMDMAAAMMTANAIQAALIARMRTGEGQRIETKLIEAALNMLGNFHMSYLATGVSPTRFGNTQNTAVPVGSFETRDGPIYLACANDRIFRRLMTDVLGRPDLAHHPDYATSKARRDNQKPLLALIGEALRRDDRANWLARMHAAGVAAGAIRTVGEALQSAEVAALDLLSEIEHPVLGPVPNVGLPIHFSRTPLADPVAAPMLGVDTDAVLGALLGYGPDRILQIAREGGLGRARQDAAREVLGTMEGN